MSTTLTSAIINVNVSKLKKDLEALGDIKVQAIEPKDGANPTAVIMVRGDGVSNLTGSQQIAAQAVIDAHVDLQDEDLRLLGRNDAVFGNVEAGTLSFYNAGVARWRINSSNHLIPVTSASFDIGSAGLRVNQYFGISANFSGDVSISGNLTVSGTITTINTVNLDIADNVITLNSDWVGAPTEDAGILIERGSSTDAQLIWNETTDKFQAGITSDMQNLIRQVEFDTHVNNVSNPHSVTKAQIGLSNVTDDAQLKRAGGDFNTFPVATIENSDIFLFEDANDTYNKKKNTFLHLNQNLSHANLVGVVGTTYTHTQIDSHINDLANPHAVTKAQVGLTNVTDDAQLKRAASDFSSFAVKASPTTSDVLLIEDAAASGAKKHITIANLPFSGSGTLDGFPLTGTPTNGVTIRFDSVNSEWDYIEEGIAKKIPTGLGNKEIDQTSIPDDAEYLRYDQGLDKIVWAPAPGVSSSGPIGSIIAFAASTPPIGYLDCDGSAVSRTFYADLFAVIGTTYGVGDGSTTFNLPDTRQRFLLGLAVSGTGSTLGGVGGQIDHQHTLSTSATGQTGGAGLLLTSTSTGTSNPPFMAVKHCIKYSDNILANGTTNISNDINFSGVISQKTHSAYTGSQEIKKTFGYQTTNATPQAALSIPLADATVTYIEVKITARYQDTGTNHSYVARIFGGVRRNNGGAAVLIDTPEIADLIAENPTNFSVDLGVSGNNVTILVTGATGETVNWTGSVTYQSVSLAS